MRVRFIMYEHLVERLTAQQITHIKYTCTRQERIHISTMPILIINAGLILPQVLLMRVRRTITPRIAVFL